MLVSIIIPCFKEIDNIKKLTYLILSQIDNPKIIIIDDSPTDEIKNIIRDQKKIHYIYRGKKLGRGSAVLNGIKYSLQHFNSEIFIEMDADLSHDPLELKNKIDFFNQNNLDLLISSRYLKKSKIINWPIERKIFSYFANLLARILLKIPITDYTNGYRIYSKKAASHIVTHCGQVGDGFVILSEILVELYYNGFKIEEIETIFLNRLRGESSVNLNEIVKSLFGIFKIYKLKNKITKHYHK